MNNALKRRVILIPTYYFGSLPISTGLHFLTIFILNFYENANLEEHFVFIQINTEDSNYMYIVSVSYLHF